MADRPSSEAGVRPPGEEAPCDPGIEIVDPHHHLFSRPGEHYLAADLAADAAASGHRVVQSVYVESGWGISAAEPQLLAPVAEVRLAVKSAAESRRTAGPVIAGIVGHADLRLAGSAGATLDALAAAADGLLVGIRHSTAWDSDPAAPVHRIRPAPGLMASPAWRAGFREVARRSLVFDAWVYHPQLPEVEELASAFSDTPIVVNHLGGPLRVGRYRLEQALAEARVSLTRLSKRPNVYLKIGGVGMTNIGREWMRSPSSGDLAATWGPYVRWCVEEFGASRCMFESNFPVDRETCSYGVLWNAFKLMVAGASASEKAALFAGTARSFYSLNH